MVGVFESLIVDQRRLIESLISDISNLKSLQGSGGVAHSWLFLGSSSSARTNVAVAFAAALVCRDNGCGNCLDCSAVMSSAHIDVERFNQAGLSIKADQIRELVVRSSWAPAVSGWRVMIVEDADRLTETAANALLKTIEEPEIHKVWLLCSPTLSDVPLTVSSRCRHVSLQTPPTSSIKNHLISKMNLSESIADFASRISQGDIGRALLISTDQGARMRHKEVLSLIFSLRDIDSCFRAAQKLLDIAQIQVDDEHTQQSLAALERLKDAYQGNGRGMISGGAKAIKELEKEQRLENVQAVRNHIDRALLDMATLYRDVLLIQNNGIELINNEFLNEVISYSREIPPQRSLQQIELIMVARRNLAQNAAPLATLEALFCALR
jgi:DNA polymerase-3 subunit delta'